MANNFVGVDNTGNVALGNQSFGIEVSGGNSNSIGGNIVGGNSDGIEIDNGGQTNIVQGNFIGVGVNGSAQVGNKLHGIALRSDDSLTPPLGPGQTNEPGVRNNLIGGLGAGDGNTIAFNAVAGIAVFGNPVSLSGQGNTGNTIERNSIFQNGRSDPPLLSGIDLTNGSPYPKDDGPTPNDSKGHGAANDPNNFQDFPLLSSITPTGTGAVLQGTLDEPAAANITFRIDFYASNADPQNGVVEGQFFLGSGAATTNASGHASFTITVRTRVALNQLITATATDPAGNTSEFSAAIAAPSANQFYVAKVYHDLLGREVDPGGLAFWTAQLNNGLARSQMVLAIETDSHHEYYSTLVRSFYSLYLHRAEGPGDQAGATNFVNFLAAGGPIEQIRATFTASPEYFQTRGGNTANGFVNALYLDAFGTPNRVASDPGAAAFAMAISKGTMTTSQVSLDVFNSDEFHFDLVQSYYRQFLNRNGTANELNAWVAQFKQGTVDQTVIALILGSPEAFALASTFTPPAPALRNPTSINPDLYGPIFSDVALNGRSNLNDLYVFRAPGDTALTPNFGNTDLIVTVSPFAGALTPISFDPRMTLDFNVVNTTGHLAPDFTFRATFAPPVAAGQTFNQVVTLRLIQGNTTTTIAQYTYVGSQTIPPVAFANNITFPGDAIATGKFIAGVFDDPSFFDAQGYAQFARTPSSAATPLPRPAPANPAAPLPTDAKNFYHNANILALVLEVPTTKLTTANPPLLGAWADSKVNGVQVQRVGRPLLDALLIPPVPRTDLSRGDRRTAFNQGSPSTDVAGFRADMIAVLTSLNFIYQRSQPDATALVDAAFGATIVGSSTGLLPDMLTVNLSKLYTDATNGFPNGHRLRDDVVDTLFNLLTNGKVTTDNVADDNGTTITDGLGGIGATTLFPYIGKPNTPPGGGNP